MGEWVTNDTVKVVQGIAKEKEDGRTAKFLVVLQVKIVGYHGETVKVLPTGVFSNPQGLQAIS